jgi:exopolysaccharide biosynthesis polyprenyl glycosylphosphotransferase
MGLDVVLYNLALIMSFYIRYWGKPPKDAFFGYEDITTWVVGIPMVVFYLSGLYSIKWREAVIADFGRVIRAVFFTTVGVLIVVHFFRGQEHIKLFPTRIFIYSLLISGFLIGGWRHLIRKLYQHFEIKSGLTRNLLIVGIEGLSAEVLRKIRENQTPTYNILGYLGALSDPPAEAEDLACLGKHENLADILEKENVGEVLFVAEGMTYRDMFSSVRECDKAGVAYRVVPTFLDVISSNARVDLINYVPMVRYGRAVIEGWDALIKNVFDKSTAFLLIVLASPIMLIAFIAVRIESRGFPIFMQKRVGKNGKLFSMFKFRTMHSGAEKDGSLTRDNDPRITRIGRILRKTSIDELPQLFNVLFGTMSLVGPRAVVPYVADKFDDIERMTLNVLPGITGLAQVSGRDELGFHGKSLLNIYYIRNYSILLDIKILFKTVEVVLLGEGTGGTRRDWKS